ncbi:MAG: hypothetical protein ACRDVK_06025 [Acidimicrobiia bacterium]
MSRIPFLGHGIGGRLDLPVPVTYFAAGAAVVLIVTFVALAALWTTPRLQGGPQGVVQEVRPPIAVLRWIGIAGLLLAMLGGVSALVTGRDSTGNRNIAPVLLWVFFWLVVPFASVVLGNLYSGVNPWRTLCRFIGIGERESNRPIERLGVWPAAVGLVGFAWLELVYPDSALPSTIAIAALVYSMYLIALTARYGRESALASFDIFTPYNRLFSSIGPWGRNPDGRLVRRGWLRALTALPAWKGLAALLVVMIATVSFDGLSNTVGYEEVTGSFGMSIGGRTVYLVMSCLLVGGAYYLACWAAARLSGDSQITAHRVASRFAHTLVPIAFAYSFAHYFTLIIFEGQSIISAAADPFGLGWDLFGARDYKIDFFLGAIPVWYIQLATIIAGHIAGVVLAHDRALADFKGIGAVRSQYAMLVLMVLLTGLGLFILAG